MQQEIERKKEIFAETEKEIEAQLEAEEERELVKEKDAASVSSDGESNDGVGQVDRKGEKSKSSPHSHGKLSLSIYSRCGYHCTLRPNL